MKWLKNQFWSGRSGKTWVLFGIFIILFSVTPHKGKAVTLDREGAKAPEGILTDLRVSLRGHTFAGGTSARTYTFEGYAIYKESVDGEIYESVPLTFKTEVVWHGNTHQLTVHTTEKNGYVSNTTYQCGKMDPLLVSSSPNCKLVSCKTNIKGHLPVVWGDSRSDIQRFRDAITSGQRQAMIWEALAKSARLTVSNTEVRTPPGSVLLMAQCASDVPMPAGWKVKFWVAREDGQPIVDYLGHKITFPQTRKWTGTIALCSLKNLPPGIYAARLRMMTSLTTTYEGEKVLFKVIPKEVVSWDAETEYPVPSIVMPKEKKITGSSVIFRILMADDRPDLYLWIDYSRDSGKFPFTMYKNFHIRATNDKTWKYDKASHTYGAWISLPDVGDYRARVQALYSKSSNVGTDIWSEWRVFHVGTHRHLRIVSPAKDKVYPDVVPLKIILPETEKSDLKIVLTWVWTEAPTNGAHHFFQVLFTQTVEVAPGSLYYKGFIPVSKLTGAKDKVVKGGGFNGSFGLKALVMTTGGGESAFTDFSVAQLAAPASEDQNQKKNLIHPMTFSGPAVLPLKLRYRSLEEIGIRMKTAGTNHPAFQVRFRPTGGGSYTLLRRVPHRFSRLGEITTLHLKFKEPGRYQIRFREGDHGVWGSWHTFEVAGTTLAGAKKIKPVHSSTSAIHLASPEIMSPRSRQAFMLAGREVQVKTRLRHASGMKVALEVQFKNHGRFTAIHPKLGLREGKTETVVTMRLTKAGTYRLRARQAAASNAPWSSWREFRVDRPAKKLIHKVKPSSPAKGMHLNPSGVTIK